MAPAKLTLSLRITGVRNDGYHLLEAEMVTIDLADTLTFEDGDSLDITDGGPGRGVPADRSNTVARALSAVGRSARVRIHKRIPAGAGLGGASADAAAVFRWAGVSDAGLAAKVGADVPFCVRGGRALVTGIGDRVAPLPFERRTLTLSLAPFGCPTPAVYRAWDELGGPSSQSANDLEPAALAVEPRLAEWRERLSDATGCVPSLAGSGSTWFVPGEFPGEGRVVVHTVPPHAQAGETPAS